MENLDGDTLKALLLKAIRDEWIDILNMMGKGDIYQLSFPKIFELSIHISRGKSRIGKILRDHVVSRINKFAVGTVSRDKIGNLIDEFKTDIQGFLVKKQTH